MAKVNKAEWDEFQKWKKDKDSVKVEVDVTEPEPLMIDTGELVTETTEEKDYYTCESCNYDKITRDMKACPNCKAELKW